jgi:hypothetical protein
MSLRFFRSHVLTVALCAAVSFFALRTARAQTAPAPSPFAVATPAGDVLKLDAYRVEATYSGLDPKPATTSSIVSAEEAQTYNVIVVEDAVKYLPNLAFRRRFVGDMNSGISIRGKPAVAAGSVLWSGPLRLHTLENVGATELHVVSTELKDAPDNLQRITLQIIGAADQGSAVGPAGSIGNPGAPRSRGGAADW